MVTGVAVVVVGNWKNRFRNSALNVDGKASQGSNPVHFDPEHRLNTALEAFRIGEYSKAIATAQDCAVIPEYRCPALDLLGQCYLKRDWIEEAVATFKRALSECEEIELQRALRIHLQEALDRLEDDL